jgi:hypothetical protein
LAFGEFDLYYQDVQKRIKDQQYPNADLPHAQKIDITLVVDMLLTGFDSKFLNTLYVDKNLKYHGLIQAFSRTNRVLNDTKPYGNILDFRQQQDAVDTAIGLFSGQTGKPAKEIWLVDPAPVVIEKYKKPLRLWRSSCKQRAGLRASSRAQPQGRCRAHPSSSTVSRKCSASRPSSTNTPTSDDRKSKQHRARSCPRMSCRASEGVLSGNRPAPEGPAGQGRRQASDAKTCSSSISSSCCLPASLDRLRLHHGAHHPLRQPNTGQAEDEPR